GLFWLAEGSNGVGAGPDAPIRLPTGAPDHVGSIHLAEDRAVFEPATPAPPGLSADRRPGEGPPPLRTGAARAATVVSVGSVRFHLLERGGRVAARVRDRNNAARSRLGPIPSFPVDPAWRFDARFEAYDPPRRMPVTSVV